MSLATLLTDSRDWLQGKPWGAVARWTVESLGGQNVPVLARPLDCMELEDRTLLNAAPPVAPPVANSNHQPAHAANAPLTASVPTANVVLIDTQLTDYQLLVQAALPSDKVILYDGQTDSANRVLAEVVAWAESSHTEIGSLSVLDHGVGGAFELGNQWLTATTLGQTSSEWQQLGSVLAKGAEIELYGCDVAEPGSEGQALLDQLSQLTGAGVFASTNVTGQGGDWNLEAASTGAQAEVATGLIAPFDSSLLNSYDGTLGTIAVDSTTAANSAGAVTSLSFAHTVGSGSNGLLAVEVVTSAAAADVSSVTYGGTALTLASTARTTSSGTAEIWYLTAPTVGTANVVVNLSSADYVSAGATSLFNVNQSTPIASTTTYSGSSAAPSETIPTGNGDMVVEGLAYANAAAGVSATGTGQTQLWSAVGNGVLATASDQPANSSSVTMQWSANVSANWAIAAVNLQAAPTDWVVTNTNDSGAGSLRQAILNADGNSTPNEITFDIAGNGAHTITLASVLPTISQSVTIDGTSQPSYAGTPLIELNVASIGSGNNALTVSANNVTIEGLSIVGTPNGNGIDAFGVSGLTVEADYIGLTPAGTVDANSTGIALQNVTNSTIGGTTAGTQNIISGNSNGGIWIGSGSNNNVVEGNYIGTNAAGTVAKANTTYGIQVAGSANNTIGGTVSGARNIISGNTGPGIEITGASSTGNVVEGNYIGTNLGGTSAIANSGDGIEIDSGASSNTVGGAVSGALNLISGNGAAGVELTGSGTTGNVIAGNYIGVNAAGTGALANGSYGVYINNGASSNTIGGPSASYRNILSGNDGEGVYVDDSSTSGNTIEYDYIGTNAAGLAAISNGSWGIAVDNDAAGTTITENVISGNTTTSAFSVSVGGIYLYAVNSTITYNDIGLGSDGSTAIANGNSSATVYAGIDANDATGSTSISYNHIANNVGPGIDVLGTSSGVNIYDDEIYANSGIGIDLNGDGVTSNTAGGPHSGPNSLQNYPVLTAAYTDTTSDIVYVNGTLNSAANETFRIDIYADANPSGTGHGGAEYFLGTFNVTTDGSGNASFATANDGYYQGALPAGTAITATATDPNGNTSEFAANRNAVAGGLIVTNNSDTVNGTTTNVAALIANPGGDGISLREAILAADNTTIAGKTIVIEFDIAGSGVHTISPTAALPYIASNIEIDGYSQPGYSGSPLIELNGSSAGSGAAGLDLTYNGSDVYALSIVDFSGDGIDVGSSFDIIASNYIGILPDGVTAAGNGGAGIVVTGRNNFIGDGLAGAGNVISGNDSDGVIITGNGAINNTLNANYIGLNAAGTAKVTNAGDGVWVTNGANSNTIGSATAGLGNVISGNTWQGILFDGSATGNLVIGNYIGLDHAGTAAIGNAGDGVRMIGAGGNTVGGTAAGDGNVISGNGTDGISAESGSSGTLIQGNYIGTDYTGTTAIGNTDEGVELYFSGSSTVSGSNVISGNGLYGIWIFDNRTTADQIQSNMIGTNATGMAALANGSGGLAIQYANGNLVSGNLISGNTGDGINDIGGATNTFTSNQIGVNVNGNAAIANTQGGILLSGATGDTINGSNLLSGNLAYGLAIENASANNTVSGNKIGTDTTGSSSIANAQGGILIQNSASNTISSGNLISGNSGDGVDVFGNGSTSNVIAGNNIGVNAGGTAALANTGNGIDIDQGASSNTVGGTGGSYNGDVLGGNGGAGVYVGTGTGNQILGSFIGVNPSDTAIGNTGDGIELYGATNTTIGVASGNPVGGSDMSSGNGGWGLALLNNTTGTISLDNWFGVDTSGTAIRANGSGGVLISNSSNNTIGGSAAGDGDTISGNTGIGLQLTGAGSTGNVVQGNYIGTNYFGTALVGSQTYDVQIDTSAASNTIGGTTTLERNLFDGASIAGLTLAGSASTGNDIEGNYIGVAANGTTALANADGIDDASTGNTLGGSAAAAANLISGNTNYGIDLAGSGELVEANLIGTTAAGTAALANGQGGVYITGGSNTIGGTVSGALNLISGNTGDGVEISGASATANVLEGNYIGTDASGSTAVANTNDGVQITSGATSNTVGSALAGGRNILSGNSDCGIEIDNNSSTLGNTVIGNYIGLIAGGTAALGNNNCGVFLSGSSNNTIGGTAAGDGNVISGNDVHGIYETGGSDNLIQANEIGTDSTGTIAIGNLNYGIKLLWGVSGDTISGANVISGNLDGIVDEYGTDNLIQSNYIGTDKTGTVALGNTQDGLYLQTTSGDTISGANVISGNAREGVNDQSGTDDLIQANYIGTDKTGTVALGNGAYGVELGSASGDTISGANVISGNSNSGIYIVGNGTAGNTVSGNNIGTNTAGTGALANGGGGVLIENSRSNTIGGNAAGDGNTISGNTGVGLEITGAASTGNVAQGNYVGANTAGTALIGSQTDDVEIDTSAASNTIGGTTTLTRNLFDGASTAGLTLAGSASTGNVIEGNYIGVAVNGTTALANADGIDDASTGNTIGGSSAAAGNVISGNTGNGVNLTGSGELVEANLIGTTADGSAAVGNGASGIDINGGSNSIGGATAGAGNTISGNTGNGISVSGSASNNDILGNYVGTNVTGTAAVGNHGIGILVQGGHNTIGGPSSADRNVVSGNGDAGIRLSGGSATGNLVQENYVGLNAAGTGALGNATFGIILDNGANGNTVGTYQAGGSDATEGNVIAASGESNICIDGVGNDVIAGNYIGTNAGATASLSYCLGVWVTAGSTNIQIGTNIGGSSDGYESNVISGNATGISIDGSATGVTIAGNDIGTNATGTSVVANTADGIDVSASNNTIGASGTANRNIISGNTADGIDILAGSGNLVQNNYVGTTFAGSAALANTNGIVDAGSGTTIGGTSAAVANVISGNTHQGIQLAGSGALVEGNRIGVNAAGAAALGNGSNGLDVTGNSNTVGSATALGANVISGNALNGILLAGTSETVIGNLIGTDKNGTTAIANARDGVLVTAANETIGGTAAGDRNVISGNAADGIEFSGASASGSVVQGNYIGTNINGNVALANAIDGVILDAGAAHNTIGGTSAAARNIVSGNTLDGITLDGAATTGNLLEGNYIGLNAAGTGAVANWSNGVLVTNGASGNTIGGASTGAGNVISGNKNSGIEVDGTVTSTLIEGNIIGLNAAGNAAVANAAQGIDLQGGGNTVGGNTTSARNTISGNTADGILVETAAANANSIQNNYIGTDTSGTAMLGNASSGVFIEGGTDTSVIGNLISGSSSSGIGIFSASTTDNIVQGNQIGTNAAGNSALGNANGIVIDGSADNTIGGTTSGQGNLVSGNSGDGIVIQNAGATGNLLEGNSIGTTLGGLAALANVVGVLIQGGSANNTVGGTVSGATNLIAENTGAGVAVSGNASTGNAILENSIYGNGGLGIDLNDDGVTPNHTGGPVVGPNGLQNFPVLQSVSTSGGSTSITGIFNSVANTTYRLEFFDNGATADPSGYGQGKAYLGAASVTTDASGNASFSVTLPVSTTNGDLISATATVDLGGGSFGSTSEFAQNLGVGAVDQAPTITVPATQTINENASLVFSTGNGNQVSVGDADARGMSEQVSLAVLDGTLTLATTSGLTFSSGTGSGDASMQFTGTIAAINAALNGLTYNPTANFTGTDGLGITVDDLGNTGVGGPLWANGSVGIDVYSSNAPVNSVPNTQTVADNSSLVFDSAGGNPISVSNLTPEANVQADLSGAYNREGIVTDGTSFSSSGGFDGQGYALSRNELGSSLTWNGQTFALGAANSNNVVSAIGQTITLPSGNYSQLDLVAAANNGNQPNQTFTVAYTDGSTQSFTQSISDWGRPQAYGGESIVVSTPNRDTSSGGQQGGPFDVYGYSFALNPAKTIQSITLPSNDNVEILAIGEAGGVAAGQITLSVGSGTLALASTTGLTFTAGSNDSASMTFEGTQTALDNALVGLAYTPPAGLLANSSTTLTLTSADLSGSSTPTATATVGITIDHVDLAPVNTVPGSQTINDNNALVFNAANGNQISVADRDANGAVEEVTLGVASGSLTLATTSGLTFEAGANDSADMTVDGTLAALNAALNGLTYTPPAGLTNNTSDMLTFTSNDLGSTGLGGPLSATSTVGIVVDHVDLAPVNTVPGTQTVNDNTTLVFDTANNNKISVTDRDANGGVEQVALSVASGSLTLAATNGLTFVAGASGSANMTIDGTLAALNTALDGLTYTPPSTLNISGADTLTITTNDLGNTGLGSPRSTTSTVGIAIGHVDLAPTIVSPTTQTVLENNTLTFSGSAGNPITAADRDANGAVEQLTLAVASGSLSLAKTNGLSFTTGSGTANATMVFTGTLANINAALDGLTYTPNTFFVGADALRVTVNDLGNTGSGGPRSTTATTAIVVTADAPLISLPATQQSKSTGLVFSTATGNPITVSLANNGGNSVVEVSLAANDGTITLAQSAGLTGVSSTTSSGTITFSGTVSAVNGALEGLSFSPSSLTSSLQITVTNPSGTAPLSTTATVSITQVPLIAPPITTTPSNTTATTTTTTTATTTAASNASKLPTAIDTRQRSDASNGAHQVTIAGMQSQQDVPRSGAFGFQQGSNSSRVDGLMDSIGLDVGHFAPLETSIAGRLMKGDAGRNASSSVQLTTDEIDEIAREIRMHEDRGAVTFETVAYVGTALSSGYVIWCLRAGTFVAGALSTIPAWASFDPLPVVEFWEKDRRQSKDDHELDASFGPMPDEEPLQRV